MTKGPAERKLDFCDGKFSHHGVRKVCNPDLSVTDERRKVTVDMLCILDKAELDGVCGDLGAAFGGTGQISSISQGNKGKQ